MALVYEARREGLEGVAPRVAIKIILPDYQKSKTFRQLFVQEARLGASMQHQNLVQIQDFDSEGDTYFLVMEYVEGLTLRKIIGECDRRAVSIPMDVIAELGRQACDGLHFAHTAVDESGMPLRLVHRDIKPSNLILTPHGVVKVLDFGISKGVLRDDNGVMQEERKGSVKGTWGYMAPEQAVGEEIGPPADVFGLATVLYELAARRPMFTDQSKEEIRRLLQDDHAARVVASLDGQAYGPLVSVLIRALQRDPEARFSSAEEFGRELAKLLDNPVSARDAIISFYRVVEGGQPSGDRVAVRQPAPEGEPEPDELEDQRSAVPAPSPGLGGLVFVAGAAGSVLVLSAILAGIVMLVQRLPAQSSTAGEVTMVAGTPPREAPALASDEPAGPAGEGAPGEERPPPLDARRHTAPRPRPKAQPEVEAPQPEVVAAPSIPEEAEVAAPAAEGPVGILIVNAKQKSEVYIEGRYIDTAPVREVLPVGTYEVHLVAIDGRRRLFEVEVLADEKVRKVWDFDRMEWR